MTVNAVIVRPAVVEPVPDAAVMVAEVDAVTADVDTVKVAVVAPEATVAVAGTVAVVLFEERFTTTPAVGAFSAIVTVPVTEVPPETDELLSVRDVGCGIVRARAAVAELPVTDAVTVADVGAETAEVVAVNVAVEAPAATVTEAGTVTAVLDDASVTACPPAAAAVLRVTVPVIAVPFPPSMVEAERVRLEIVAAFTPRTWLTRPWKFSAPRPVTVSQPAAALDVEPLGRVPLLPDVTSNRMLELPL